MSDSKYIEFTLLGTENTIYTNSLTPISAVPWPNRFEKLIFPTIPINYSQDNVIWDFGDGTTYTGVSASHIYNWPGKYEIKLTIIDSGGNPVTSTKSYTVSAVDMVPTQIEWRDDINVHNIPSGSKISPILFDFKISWQNYQLNMRESGTCPTGTQHWMNPGKQAGKWMCGDEHPEDIEPPIYTFNLYASGAVSPHLNISEYANNKYSHLKPYWTFYSMSSALSSIPTDSLDMLQLDSLTGSPGTINTYEKIYHGYNQGSETYEQVFEDTPGSVFTGISGTGGYYYYDSVPKCNDSRKSTVTIFTELDGVKTSTGSTSNKYNLPGHKYVNTRILKRNDIKPRVNTPSELLITSNGIAEFEINKNKWQDSEIQFTITFTDSDMFNIIDNSEYNNVNVILIDAETGNPLDIESYTITTKSSPGKNYYIGTLNCSTTALSAQLSGTATYAQQSGYKYDAIVGYVNMYRPLNGTVPETGTVFRYFHQSTTEFDSDVLADQLKTTHAIETTRIDTSGSITQVVVSDPGANLTGPPTVTISDPTGTGAELACTYNQDTQSIDSIKIIKGGINYSYPVLQFLSNKGATNPVATATIETNYECKHLAVGISTGYNESNVWALDSGTGPRILKFDNRQSLIATKGLAATPVDIKLDSNQLPWICTNDNKVCRYNPEVIEIDIEIPLVYTPVKIDTGPTDQLYICSSKTVNLYEPNDYLQGNLIINRTYTMNGNILDILSTGNGHIYILLDDNSIVLLNTSLELVDTIYLPTPVGSWSNLSTTTDSNVYLTDNVQLYKITGNSVSSILTVKGTPNLSYICGDSKGYIWLIDNGNFQIHHIDVYTPGLTYSSTPNIQEYGKSSYTNYPEPEDGVTTGRILQAVGDFTGFHWLQKYGFVEESNLNLTGSSNIFSIYNKQGMVNLAKYNELHNSKSTVKSYAIQPWLNEQYTLWENVGAALGDNTSHPTSLGKLIYEKIANFTSNNNDIDDCNIESLHNYSLLYDIDLDLYNYNYPPSFKRLIDILSIKHKRLYGEFDQQTDNFDRYIEYTTQDIRENLGPVLDFKTHILTPGEKIVAFEKFSKIFSPLDVTYPLSGEVDNHGNIINSGIDLSLVGSETDTYPLSAYSTYWKWNLITPVTIAGEDILNYYEFYSYNETKAPPQVEGVIKWDDPQTTLSPTASSYNTWADDTGIVDNIIEHQLRTGLNLFTS